MQEQYQEQAFQRLFAPLDNQIWELLQIISPLGKQQIDVVPFPGSWTAAQTTRHIIKSNASIARALSLPGEHTAREPDQRVQELKELFLDFTTKFQSAPFIAPTKDHYEKERLIADLIRSTETLKDASRQTDLGEAIHHPAFGEITKLELIYFVRFHTQRHVRQVKNIAAAVLAIPIAGSFLQPPVFPK